MNVLIIRSYTVFRTKLRHQDSETVVDMNHEIRHSACPGVFTQH
jgi:hypothetical protein